MDGSRSDCPKHEKYKIKEMPYFPENVTPAYSQSNMHKNFQGSTQDPSPLSLFREPHPGSGSGVATSD